MKISIHQPQYLPWAGYFNKILNSDIFVILDDVQYKKNEWQNRNRIKSSSGELWLTVPVHYTFGQKINEIKIDNKIFWSKKHLKSIELNYKRAPFFNEIFPLVEKVLSKEYIYLVDINVELIKIILNYLEINKKIVKSSEYKIVGEKTLRLINICKTFGADIYLSGQGGKDYLVEEEFKKNGIKLEFQEYKVKEYPQLFNGFIPNLSILDILFNCGKEQTLKIIS
ncbi:MAG: WbqC family protein [Endomicrobiia bacterium]